MEDDLLTSREVAELLRVHPKHLYRLLRQGLPGHRHGRGHWRFRRAEVLEWLDARTRSPARSEPVVDALLLGRSPGAEPLRSQRVVVGRVRERWVAHALGPHDPRSADGLASHRGEPSSMVRATLWSSPQTLASSVLVAGCAPVLGMILDRAQRSTAGRAHWIPTNSTRSLAALDEGTVHVAGVHLEDHRAGRDHGALVRERFGATASLLRLVRWQVGLALAPARRGQSLAALVEPEVRWAVREEGAGARAVLARALDGIGARHARLRAVVEAADHDAIARAVALGAAEVGPCIEPVARAYGLGFLPLAEEAFDLVVPPASLALPHVARLLHAVDDPAVRREVAAVGPYDTSALGHAFSP